MFNQQTWQTNFAKLEFRLRKLSKEIWPINWSIFRQPKTLALGVLEAPYGIKVLLSVCLVGLIISTVFLSYGTYLSMTVITAASGGEIREGVVGGDLKTFNPVFDFNSDAEKKIVNLLYHPLYQVTYPDYLKDTQSQPTIKPVLLSQPPNWIDLNEANPENRYKILRFTLRGDIKWSSGQAITLEDVAYTFERLKEPRGNSQFRSLFTRVRLEPVVNSKLEFDLKSEVSNPQLLYGANFSPISKEYYLGQNTDGLVSDPKSFKPMATSGFFAFEGGPVSDPDDPKAAAKENPIRGGGAANPIKTVVLSKNPHQNLNPSPLVDRYVIRRFDELVDAGGASSDSLERYSKDKKLDLFSRYLGFNLSLGPKEIQEKIGINQKIVPTNTFYNLYLNTKLGNNVFINQFLRQYVICQFVNYQIATAYKDKLEEVPVDQRIVPIQLNQAVNPSCPENPDSILEQAKTPNGGRIYTIKEDERTGIRRVLLYGEEFGVSLVGVPESDPLLTDVQTFFLNIGIPADLIKDDRVPQVLAGKTYNAAFLPVTVASRDPYPVFGATGQDLAQLRLNNRIQDYKVEENLRAYSISNLQDQDARQKLVDFFSKEYVSVNLARSLQEYDYSDRVLGLGGGLPEIQTFADELYLKLPEWHIDTRRVWK
jgi:Bacterial extracellular solute-binding proteins, family 5 Middle